MFIQERRFLAGLGEFYFVLPRKRGRLRRSEERMEASTGSGFVGSETAISVPYSWLSSQIFGAGFVGRNMETSTAGEASALIIAAELGLPLI